MSSYDFCSYEQAKKKSSSTKQDISFSGLKPENLKQAADLIDQGMCWNLTEDGHEYWSTVKAKLFSIAEKVEQARKDAADPKKKIHAEIAKLRTQIESLERTL